MNYDPDNIIRVGTDLRFVDSSKPWDKVRAFQTVMVSLILINIAVGQGLHFQ
jgi:hypothetical protein